ncbi:MAG: DUF6178 family protein [Desulfarculales bacterium]|jgi:hypothetical protein|nr:DUF6178 family protein [Desulfarculales bacterium]
MNITDYNPENILRLEKTDPGQAQELWQSLSPEQRLKGILSANTPREQTRLILLAQDSKELVQALSSDNFARLVMDIGPADCLEIVELSSDEQLTYLLDLTAWRREELDPDRYGAWLPVIMEAGPLKLKVWLESVDIETLTLLGRHWFTVWKYVPSQDEQEPPDDLPEFTLDGIYWLEFNRPDEAALAAQIMVVLKSELPDKYSQVMEAMRWEPDSELKEYARRWRQGRLQDQGFPSREEALSLWANPGPGESAWENKPLKYAPAGIHQESGIKAWGGFMAEDELLPSGLTCLTVSEQDNLKQELTFIANCGIVALDADWADRKAAGRAAAESISLVNLGLSLLAGGHESPASDLSAARGQRAAAILRRLPLPVIARQGAGAVRGLNKQAWKILKTGWLKDLPTGFNLLDFPLDRWLAGLLFKLPRFYNQSGSPEYRAFHNISELQQAQNALARIDFWGKLIFELAGLNRLEVLKTLTAPGWPEDPLDRKLSHLLFTYWVRQALKLPGLAPLKLHDLSRAVRIMKKKPAGSWRDQAGQSAGLLAEPERGLAKSILNGLLDELETEFKNLSSHPLADPAISAEILAGMLPLVSEK